jgi:hypothetical protein
MDKIDKVLKVYEENPDCIVAELDKKYDTHYATEEEQANADRMRLRQLEREALEEESRSTRQLQTKRLTIGFFAMLWNLQTYLFGRALKPFITGDEISMAFGGLALLVHAVTVVGFGLWLRRHGSAEDRRTSYLAPLVLAYKDSHWWWFIATILHLDMATVMQVLVPHPVAGKVVQIVLALLMHVITYKVQPFDQPVLLKLMGASLLTQFAVCLSGLTMLLTEITAIRMLVDITLGMLLLAVTGRFLWELRQDIADIRRSAATRCCCCCCAACRAKHSGSENASAKNDGEGGNDSSETSAGATEGPPSKTVAHMNSNPMMEATGWDDPEHNVGGRSSLQVSSPSQVVQGQAMQVQGQAVQGQVVQGQVVQGQMNLLQKAKEAQEKDERDAIFRQERRQSQAKEAKKAAERKVVADKIFADKARADAQRKAAAEAEAKKHKPTMLVTVPPGSTAGTRVRVQTPAGLVEVEVPAGVVPGQNFEIQYELPTPGGGAAVSEPAAAPQEPQVPTISSTSQQYRTILVTVPPGSTAGTRVRVQTPAGLVEVEVPAGVVPGQNFEIQYALSAQQQKQML